MIKKQLQNKKHVSRKQLGQSMAEVAISFSMLIFILSATVDIGRAFFAYIAIRDASQEGAAYGSLFPWDRLGIDAHVRASSTDPFDLTDLSTVSVATYYPSGSEYPGTDVYPADLCAGDTIRVIVNYDLNFFMPLIDWIVPSGRVLLTANMVNTVIYPPC